MNPLDQIRRPEFYPLSDQWSAVLNAARERVASHGDLARWEKALTSLPQLPAEHRELTDAVCVHGAISEQDRQRLEAGLRGLHPWRKGPVDLFGVLVDTEWRSDWKWTRIAGALGNLTDQRVLDVGCGNGYFGWRALGAGAKSVLGVDPSVLFFLQHLALCRYLSPPDQDANFLLPVPFEILPEYPFDLVLSMGVIYHRVDPLEHVRELYRQTRPGGRLLLESLVVLDGPDLTPAASGVTAGRGRYARMRNVHTVPRVDTMIGWLETAGYRDIATVDVSPTSLEEQRSTDWMTFESLAECLDPEDPARTVEGYPAPVRVAILAHRE